MCWTVIVRVSMVRIQRVVGLAVTRGGGTIGNFGAPQVVADVIPTVKKPM